ncbi:MAG: tripartite tricarboxylate transporter permease [Planctomycetota bacterium]|jgi:putative tricarboxylic transport membrane protein|nr:tripartite tricarboxylate transporter permease [Planctomycetota bacterium]
MGLEMFGIGFAYVVNPATLFIILIDVVVGIVFGAIPGLTGTMAIALCLPLTFEMTPVNSFALLMGLYVGSCSGGLISAILLKIPGTPSSIATTFDGIPMADRGEAGKALGAGIVYSFLGGFFSFAVLFLIAPPLAAISVRFGPYEYFAIALFALTLISSVSGDSALKGMASGFVGMTLATAGISPMDGFPRFTFGVIELAGGFSLLPVMMGLFAVSELLRTVGNRDDDTAGVEVRKIRGFGFTMGEFWEQKWNFVRSCLIGTGIGILPGLGGSSANILAYIAAKKCSKHPEKFGTGILDGIVAPESANNAAVGGALVPLLTLGIPGDTVTAMLIGAFMVHGLNPGPLLFQHSGDVVYALFASLIVANFVMIAVEFWGIRIFVNLLRVPKHVLLPAIIVMCLVGAFGLNNRVFDIWTVIAFGALGHLMHKYRYPLTPLILGFILGPMAELNLRRGLQMAEGNFFSFFNSPVAAFFIAVSLLSLLRVLGGWGLRMMRRQYRGGATGTSKEQP